jgi:VCBS repeat-containing protein
LETYTPVQAASATTYYRRKVTNLGRDAYSNVLTFTVNALPTVTATASPVSVISGGTTTLSATGAATYAWTGALLNTNNTSSVTANPTAQTTYTVTGTDANGCVNTATVTVNVQPLLAGTISGTQDVCAGATPSTITSSSLASGGSGSSYSYVWQEATDVGFTQGVSTISGETGTELSFSVATTSSSVTKYYRRGVKDASDPGTAYVYTAPVVKTIRQLPTVTVLSNPTTSVPAGASVTLTATASPSGTYTYSWTNSGGAINPTTVTPSATTSYTVTVTDQYLCSTTSSSVTVTVSPLDGGEIASTKNSVCTGSIPQEMTSTSPASGGTGAPGDYSYQWQISTTSNTAGFTDIPTFTATTFTPTQTANTTTYFRRKVTNLTRVAYSNVLTFTVNALPTVTATASPASVISGGQSTLTAQGATSFTYSPTTGLNPTSGSPVVATVTAQTTYTVTGTDASGCVNTATVTVNVQPLLAGTIAGNQDVCVGATPSQITSSSLASGGSGSTYSYVWQEHTSADFTGITALIPNETGTSLSFTVATTSTSATKYYRRGVKDASDPGTAYV